jgi:hypothetical protein
VTHFGWLAGVADSLSVATVPQEEYATQVMKGLKTRLADWLVRCRVVKKRDYRQLTAQLKPAAMLCSGVFSLYLVVSSVYVYQLEQRLNEQYQQRAAEITSVLAKQNLVDKQLVMYKEGQQNLERLNLSWRVWGVMLSLGEHNLRLSQIEYTTEQVVLRGTTKSASALLSTLSQHPGVVDAKFITAVSRQRGGERFAIAFKLKGEADELT